MLLYLPVYPNSVIATSTAPCLSLPQGHKSERVSFQFRTGRMIVLKKEGQRLLKKKTKKPLWKENPFLEGQEGRTLWHYKIKTWGECSVHPSLSSASSFTLPALCFSTACSLIFLCVFAQSRHLLIDAFLDLYILNGNWSLNFSCHRTCISFLSCVYDNSMYIILHVFILLRKKPWGSLYSRGEESKEIKQLCK